MCFADGLEGRPFRKHCLKQSFPTSELRLSGAHRLKQSFPKSELA